MKQLVALVLLLATLALPIVAHADPIWPANTAGGGCSGPSTIGQVVKVGVLVVGSSAAEQQAVALAAGKLIHVCAFQVTATSALVSTVSLLSFQLATGAACAGASGLWAVNVPSSGPFNYGQGTGDNGLFDVPSGDALCVLMPTFSAGAIFVSITYSQF